ncbi:16S rRNA (guanine(966)-N(2))-methyltransferase RsmD [candidate division KSB1 bacterium]
MRVISGRYKGFLISTKSSIQIRPTTSRIKEWIFQIIGPYLPDSCFLDLFAGSGNLGIEALSRGSKMAVFVDKHTGGLIRRNLNALGPEEKTKVVKEDVIRCLKKHLSGKIRFSVIAADPPYEYDSFSSLLSALYQSQLLIPGGLFILESSRHSSLSLPEEFYSPYREKKFGETVVRIFQRGI